VNLSNRHLPYRLIGQKASQSTAVKFTPAAPLALVATLGADRISKERRRNCGTSCKSAAAVPQNVRQNFENPTIRP